MHGEEVGKGIGCGKAAPRQGISGILRGGRGKQEVLVGGILNRPLV